MILSDAIEDLAYQIDPEQGGALARSTWERLRTLTARSGKRCIRCHTTRPLFQFGLNRYGEDGLARECAVCHHGVILETPPALFMDGVTDD